MTSPSSAVARPAVPSIGDTPVAVADRTLIRDRATVVVFTLASLLGSTLLFLVQPIIGRLLLPLAGGTASLWNTAMVFFQAALLLGYLLAHLGTSLLGVARHRYAHLLVLVVPLAFLPIAVPGDWSLDAGRDPIVATLGVLAVMVGMPFLALATSSPTLQRWFAATDHPHASNPYFLYAAGNVGSLTALLAYPFVIERHLGLDAQTKLFTAGYVAFIVCTAAAALLVPAHRGAIAARVVPQADPIAWARRGRWVAWSFVPSALLLGTTRFITTDVASFPLLWIVPLVLYLTTFIVAFGVRDPERVTALAARAVVIGAIPLALTFLGRVPMTLALGLHLGWLLAAALLAHGRLASDRPPASRLTEFYAWVSLGGVLGGSFVALVAPIVFTRLWEYPLAIFGALLLVPAVTDGRHRPLLLVVAAATTAAGALLLQDSQVQLATLAMAAAGLIALRHPPVVFACTIAAVMAIGVGVTGSDVVAQHRSFFGTYAVLETDEGGRVLQMGTTIHGSQNPERAGRPTTYYHPDGPLGSVFDAPRAPMDAALIGLGAGEIAAYGLAGDQFTFYEIDQVVVDIATDPAHFTYLRDTRAEVDVVVGDGRIELARSSAVHDVVVVDAFSSDAIPVHLLTREAVVTYLDHLTPDGLLLLHVSNRHLELAPVIERIGSEIGTAVRMIHYVPDAEAERTGAAASIWVAMARSATTIDALDDRWVPVPGDGPLWTDDYSNVLAVLGG